MRIKFITIFVLLLVAWESSQKNLWSYDVFDSWAGRTNNGQIWPLSWTSLSGNQMQMSFLAATNLWVTNGTLGMPFAQMTNSYGSQEALCLFGATDAAPYEAIGMDLYFDTITNGVNFPEYAFTLVSSPSAMIVDHAELAVPKWLHMQFYIIPGNNTSKFVLDLNTNGLTSMDHFETDIGTASSPLLSQFGNGTLHNCEARLIATNVLELLLDGQIVLIASDNNLPQFWGNATAWWEYWSQGYSLGAPWGTATNPVQDQVRNRILDVYTRVNNPQSTATFLNIRNSSGHAGITVDGPAGTTNTIQYATVLGHTNWLPLTNIVLFYGPSFFIDAESLYTGKRFYRAVRNQ